MWLELNISRRKRGISRVAVAKESEISILGKELIIIWKNQTYLASHWETLMQLNDPCIIQLLCLVTHFHLAVQHWYVQTEPDNCGTIFILSGRWSKWVHPFFHLAWWKWHQVSPLFQSCEALCHAATGAVKTAARGEWHLQLSSLTSTHCLRAGQNLAVGKWLQKQLKTKLSAHLVHERGRLKRPETLKLQRTEYVCLYKCCHLLNMFVFNASFCLVQLEKIAFIYF